MVSRDHLDVMRIPLIAGRSFHEDDRARLYAWLIAVLAGVGVVLALTGIYGVIAYTVAQRTREMGIRVALGARHTDVIRLVLARGLVLTGIGLAAGLGGAAVLARYLEGMLFGLTPLDWPTFAAVSVLFACAATVAALVPAHRAATVDPLVALRTESLA